MARKITPSERAVSWRKEKLAAGYKQKAFLLSPQALKRLAALAAERNQTELDVIEELLAVKKAVRR